MSKFIMDQERREKWISFIYSLTPDINPKAVQLMDEMRQVSHSLYQIRESSVNETGLSYAKFRILMSLMFSQEIEGREELNPSEISQRQGTSRNTISALIRDLENDGLIERHLDKNDRRKFNIRLTEAGQNLVRDHLRHHFRIVGNCFNTLSDGEKNTLSHLLNQINVAAQEANS
ncbi:MAG: winged helix-turn-helix transcriptional regulator [Chloroflexi bacterium]|nr:winged helix-turn-helix transcriptional regulator [Chloroflexota bacterium]